MMPDAPLPPDSPAQHEPAEAKPSDYSLPFGPSSPGAADAQSPPPEPRAPAPQPTPTTDPLLSADAPVPAPSPETSSQPFGSGVPPTQARQDPNHAAAETSPPAPSAIPAPNAIPMHSATPSPTPPSQPPQLAFTAAPPPSPLRVQEVEAVPLTSAEAKARSIDAPPTRSTPQPQSSTSNAPPAASMPPPQSTGTPLQGVTQAAPPPPSSPLSPSQPASAPEKKKSRIWVILCHLFLFLVIPTVFLGTVITFFVWQLKGKSDPQIEDQGREALNFQINVAIITLLLGASCLGGPLVPFVWLIALIMCIIAARRAAAGENYRYPWILRIVTH